MSDIEIPEVLLDAVAPRTQQEAHRVREAFAAGLPSLRRQVLESVVEDVAEAINPDAWMPKTAQWEIDYAAKTRQAATRKARRVLGISEGDGHDV